MGAAVSAVGHGADDGIESAVGGLTAYGSPNDTSAASSRMATASFAHRADAAAAASRSPASSDSSVSSTARDERESDEPPAAAPKCGALSIVIAPQERALSGRFRHVSLIGVGEGDS